MLTGHTDRVDLWCGRCSGFSCADVAVVPNSLRVRCGRCPVCRCLLLSNTTSNDLICSQSQKFRPYIGLLTHRTSHRYIEREPSTKNEPLVDCYMIGLFYAFICLFCAKMQTCIISLHTDFHTLFISMTKFDYF